MPEIDFFKNKALELSAENKKLKELLKESLYFVNMHVVSKPTAKELSIRIEAVLK